MILNCKGYEKLVRRVHEADERALDAQADAARQRQRLLDIEVCKLWEFYSSSCGSEHIPPGAVAPSRS